VRELIGSDYIALAYAVQEFNVVRRLKAGHWAVDRKIGMTSVAVQITEADRSVTTILLPESTSARSVWRRESFARAIAS